MNELDEIWTRMLDDAAANALAAGRADVADFLALKQSNDAIRRMSIGWLFDSLIEIASEANRDDPSIVIEREEPHEFDFRNARMAGSLVRVRWGVRSLTAEAGWTRTPAHGFMRGGALAAARLIHFGMPEQGAELALVQTESGPEWALAGGEKFDVEELRRHFALFRSF